MHRRARARAIRYNAGFTELRAMHLAMLEVPSLDLRTWSTCSPDLRIQRRYPGFARP